MNTLTMTDKQKLTMIHVLECALIEANKAVMIYDEDNEQDTANLFREDVSDITSMIKQLK